VVGGGIQDKLLCELTASVTGRKVIAGPVEATAIGNLIIQAQALGKVKDQKHGKQIIKNSFEMEEYVPLNSSEWDSNYLKYTNILGLE
jgi:rhamnulokinase/L-fuculokinase